MPMLMAAAAPLLLPRRATVRGQRRQQQRGRMRRGCRAAAPSGSGGRLGSLPLESGRGSLGWGGRRKRRQQRRRRWWQGPVAAAAGGSAAAAAAAQVVRRPLQPAQRSRAWELQPWLPLQTALVRGKRFRRAPRESHSRRSSKREEGREGRSRLQPWTWSSQVVARRRGAQQQRRWWRRMQRRHRRSQPGRQGEHQGQYQGQGPHRPRSAVVPRVGAGVPAGRPPSQRCSSCCRSTRWVQAVVGQEVCSCGRVVLCLAGLPVRRWAGACLPAVCVCVETFPALLQLCNRRQCSHAILISNDQVPSRTQVLAVHAEEAERLLELRAAAAAWLEQAAPVLEQETVLGGWVGRWGWVGGRGPPAARATPRTHPDVPAPPAGAAATWPVLAPLGPGP